MASIYDGGSRSHAAKLGGVGLQVIRDWVLRFNADGPAGLIDRKAPGAAPKLTARQMQALVDVLERGPIPAIHGAARAVGRGMEERGVLKLRTWFDHRSASQPAVPGTESPRRTSGAGE